MNRIAKLLSVILLIALNTTVRSNDLNTQHAQDFYTIWLPGLYGGHAHENSLATTQRYTIYDVIKPPSDADLGQEQCIGDLDRQLHNDLLFQQSKKVIVIGTSQGAATWLNKLAQMSHAQQEEKIVAIILEAPLADTHEAILQSALKTPGLSYAPFVRFWSPWIAKWYHHHYQPYGLEAIASAKHISARIPVIIVHNRKDTRISVNSARKLVCALLNARHHHDNNVYYIETDIQAQYGDNHTDFLREDAHSMACFHGICKKLNIAYDAQQAHTLNDQELSILQPSVEQLEQEIHASTWRMNTLRNIIDGLTLVIFAVLLSVLMRRRKA